MQSQRLLAARNLIIFRLWHRILTAIREGKSVDRGISDAHMSGIEHRSHSLDSCGADGDIRSAEKAESDDQLKELGSSSIRTSAINSEVASEQLIACGTKRSFRG